MEINNFINLLYSGKLPQVSKAKLFDSQNFDKLMQGLQFLTNEKFYAGELENNSVPFPLKKPELEQISNLIGTIHVQNLQAVKDVSANEVMIKRSKDLAAIIYGLLNANISSESINNISEKKEAAPEKILNKDLLMKNEDANANTKDNENKDEISLLQNIISNSINVSLINSQNNDLVNSISQDDKAINPKLNIQSHESVSEFLFDKQNYNTPDLATSDFINNIAEKVSNNLEKNNIGLIKQGEDLQSAKQIQDLINEIRIPLKVEETKVDNTNADLIQKSKFELDLNENITYHHNNFKNILEGETSNNANIVSDTQEVIIGQKEASNLDIINEIIKIANTEQLPENETINLTNLETAKVQENESHNETSELPAVYVDKLVNKIPRSAQSNKFKPNIELDPAVKGENKTDAAGVNLEKNFGLEKERTIEKSILPWDTKIEAISTSRFIDKIEVRPGEVLADVKVEGSDETQKKHNKVIGKSSFDDVPEMIKTRRNTHQMIQRISGEKPVGNSNSEKTYKSKQDPYSNKQETVKEVSESVSRLELKDVGQIKAQSADVKLEISDRINPKSKIYAMGEEVLASDKIGRSELNEKNQNKVALGNGLPKANPGAAENRQNKPETQILKSINEDTPAEKKMPEENADIKQEAANVKSETIEVKPELTSKQVPENESKEIEQVENIKRETTFRNGIEDKAGVKAKEVFIKNKTKESEEDNSLEKSAVYKSDVFAPIKNKEYINTNITNTSINDTQNSTKTNEFIFDNFETDKQKLKPQNKLKNNVEHENKVLKGILEEDKEVKNKGFLTKNVHTFMSQLSALKESETVTKTNEPVIHKNSISSDLIKSVKYMEMQNIKELTVKVAPKELGELTIKLTVENGIMKANITASNENTLHLVNSHLSEINQKLVDQNMQIQSFNVSLSNNGTSYFSQNDQGNSGQQQNPQRTEYHFDNQEKDFGIEEILNENNLDILA